MRRILADLTEILQILCDEPSPVRARRVKNARAITFLCTLSITGFGTPAMARDSMQSQAGASQQAAGQAGGQAAGITTVVHQTAYWHKVDKPGKNTSSVSVTTGWHPIQGWEHNIIERDPNLAHWSWMPMQEMGKSYEHFAPGQVSERYKDPRPSRYIRPRHIPTVVQPRRQSPVVQITDRPSKYIKPEHVPTGSTAGGGNYIKPQHIATIVPPETRMDTYIKLAAPRTTATLASTQTAIRLAAPSTHVKLAAPKTHAQVASHSVGPMHASPVQTDVGLKPQPRVASRPERAADFTPPPEEQPADGDSFSNPDPYAHNVYGLARHVVSGPISTGAAHVNARLLGPRKKHR